MTLDAQHDRTALPPAPAPTDPIDQTTDQAPQGRIEEAADRPEAEPVTTPTNAFEGFGSFPG
ncbi:hypothetical protein [Methylobacterium radiodurans]|uniref:Uncharacterized protein n=1 Tax=Methylobacterium radiodurans TaxID=2202828 RepID=A0A2U8VTX6_9HYPH|nr:hypothetical protein [Methylobacterium radiodurans]AWN36891.1 hypothetical protein DK427_15070 [Methylobacterium radiodurans]